MSTWVFLQEQWANVGSKLNQSKTKVRPNEFLLGSLLIGSSLGRHGSPRDTFVGQQQLRYPAADLANSCPRPRRESYSTEGQRARSNGYRLAQASLVSRRPKVYGALTHRTPGLIGNGGVDSRPRTRIIRSYNVTPVRIGVSLVEWIHSELAAQKRTPYSLGCRIGGVQLRCTQYIGTRLMSQVRYIVY